jgi:hypothetical protein
MEDSMANRVCVRCGKTKDENKFRKSIGGGRKNTCASCNAKYDRTRLKMAMFESLGFSCACCGESNPLFLSLDHINNDGCQYREKYNEQQIYRLAIREGWPKEKYQVLCMNCNFAKGHHGECPHKSGKSTDSILNEMRAIVKWKGERFLRFQTSCGATA